MDRAGRVLVEPDLTVQGHPEIFVIGDTASCAQPDRPPVPGVAPAAKQMGRHVARIVRARVEDRPGPGPFQYRDSGGLATIGRNAAVIDWGRVHLAGFT